MSKAVIEEEKVAEVMRDFERRVAVRRPIEAQWQVNCNFVFGNQYVYSAGDGRILNEDADYYWQQRECYNHIAPIVETRLAKLKRVRPKASVRPASSDEEDVMSAKAASKILASASESLCLDSLMGRATMWSEICGSAFYKLSWQTRGGKRVGVRHGKAVYEGDAAIEVCSPFEIYPDSLSNQTVEECDSLIHARAVRVKEIKDRFGVEVAPEKTCVLSTAAQGVMGGLYGRSASPAFGAETCDDCCLLIERYTVPHDGCEGGEYVAVAGGKLLMLCDLPYAVGENFTYAIPFVKQDSIQRAGSFFGTCPVERCIPVQRAFNALINRKHEFLNRLAMGVLAVEDGSVDTQNLETEGLSPGKILLYRQGSTPPTLLDPGRLPSDFRYEEERLLNEFTLISGVSDFMRSTALPSGVTSGVAMQLLVEQDDTRLSVSAEHMRDAVRTLAKFLLRLYKQYARRPRLMRFVGSGGDVELLRFSASDISCDDVVFDTENELADTPAQRRSLLFDLLKLGLLSDENGKLSDSARGKVLDAMGYGGWEFVRDEETMQSAAAKRENACVADGEITVREIDDDALHEAEHVRFMLSGEYRALLDADPTIEARMNAHLEAHRQQRQAKEVRKNE